MVHGRQSEAHANKEATQIPTIFYLYMVYKTHICFCSFEAVFVTRSLPTFSNHLDILGLGEAQPPELQSVIADEALPGP